MTSLNNDVGHFSNSVSSASSFAEIDHPRHRQHGERTAFLDRVGAGGSDSTNYGAADVHLGGCRPWQTFYAVVRCVY
jgi:hypothetical protein